MNEFLELMIQKKKMMKGKDWFKAQKRKNLGEITKNLHRVAGNCPHCGAPVSRDSNTIRNSKHPTIHFFECNNDASSVVVYLPFGGPDLSSGGGQPTEEQYKAAQEQPIVTIRIGDPETDPDCKETLDAWVDNVLEQGLTNVRKEKFGDVEFLTFESKDEVETGGDRREERMAKMFVTILNRRSTMVRWEFTIGAWEKYDAQMNEMVKSLKVF
jgi:hypothetical protein